MHFPLIVFTIVAVALFGMANFAYSEEMSVDERVKALEERLDKVINKFRTLTPLIGIKWGTW